MQNILSNYLKPANNSIHKVPTTIERLEKVLTAQGKKFNRHQLGNELEKLGYKCLISRLPFTKTPNKYYYVTTYNNDFGAAINCYFDYPRKETTDPGKSSTNQSNKPSVTITISNLTITINE